MSDFDWWSGARLSKLVRALHNSSDVAPPPSDTAFWKAVVDEVALPRSNESANDDSSSSEEEELSPASLAKDVKHEFESAKYVQTDVHDIYLGDLGCAESRLIGLVKGIKGVIYVASHPMEPLWESDGIRYHTIVLSPAIEPSKTFASQLAEACAFLDKNRPALICSSSPSLPATVISAYMYRANPTLVPMRTLLRRNAERLELSEHLELSESDIQEADDFAQMVDEGLLVTTPKGPKPLQALQSYDSTMATFEAEQAAAEITPGKRGGGSGGKKNKREATRVDHKGRQVADGSSEEDEARARKQLKALARADCERCGQKSVLGWHSQVKMIVAGEVLGRFECAGCHDAFDEDD